jgi:ADP-heptose:LPS heptosyltransferase
LKPQLFPETAEIEEAEKAWKDVEGVDNNQRPRIVVVPGAGIQEKQWPAELFAELVSHLSKDSCGCVLGSAKDFPLGETIAARVDGWCNSCGAVSIGQSMALVSVADLAICPSTFAMHLAAAFNKPYILILSRYFDPKEHPFYWEVKRPHHQVFPRDGEENVQVVDVEKLARSLLKSLREQQVTGLLSDSL